MASSHSKPDAASIKELSTSILTTLASLNQPVITISFYLHFQPQPMHPVVTPHYSANKTAFLAYNPLIFSRFISN
jgi:hypothetical protein